MTTVAAEWETLTFDFSNEVMGTAAINFDNTYDKASIFFNFGTTGADAGEKTYYWDDVEFVAAPQIDQIDLPVTFEEPDTDYTLTDFGGNASSVVEDPTDPTNTVAQSIKTDAAELWAGTTIGTDLGFANAIPFTADATSMTVRVWSPDAGIPIRLKVEDATDPTISVETETLTTVASDWETLTFDFSNEVMGTAAINLDNTYDKASIFFNFGTTGADAGEKTYYWDDVEFVPGPQLDQIDLPVTFEDANTDYTLTDFGGNASTVVEDPTDPANTVGQSIKTDAAELWAGTTIGTDLGFANAIPFTPGLTKMTVRVWSPDANIPIRLKVEDATDPTISVETEALTTTAMAWETLEFDFSNEVMGTAAINYDNTYDKASIFFNFGTTGADAGEKTYYWDDVEFLPGSPLDQIDLPVTFEDPDTDYTLTDFGGNASTVVEDPTDPANTVGQSIKTDAAELWAGTTIGTAAGFATAIPFEAGETKMTVRVWSPDANIPIRLKVEDATDPTISVETEVLTTVASEWETLEFDFSNEVMGTAAINFANTYDKASIFFNFGTTGADAGEKTYYFDDVQFGAAPPTPITVVDIIVNSPDHETLETAVIAAELDDDLSGDGPFTVFAPTDEAFDALPAGFLDDLLMDPTGDLAQILLYHVHAGEVLSTDLSDGQTVLTMQGEDIEVTIDGADVYINQALVIMVNLQADNGVVHVIDAVVLPPSFDGVDVLNASDYDILVSPNPASDQVNVDLSALPTGKANIYVFDLNGQLLKQKTSSDQIIEINTSALSAGMYVLRIETGDMVFFQKVMISK
ncbi:MAG: T9SS type A sorting domain-containing protein [Bacteroidetes bacterium]|nr:T9SS type A sorting domain-containing protein [Bacteroidota bacterium]